MKTSITLAIAAVVFVSVANVDDSLAISRYNTGSLSCAAVKEIVSREGAVIFRYPSKNNPSLTLFDRFVRHQGFCQIDEYVARKSVPTRDTSACRIKYCKQRIPLSHGGFGIKIN